MSKRGATQQLSKEGNFFGDGSNEVSADDKPRQATAAQLANRKLKPLKGRPRVPGSGSSQSFPPAAQQQSASSAFGGFSPAPSSGGFSPAPPSGGFNFSAGPASNPFASQPAADNSNAGNNNAGGNAFSTSFTFGSGSSAASTPFGNVTSSAPASNPFGNIASSAPANNAFGNTPSSNAPSGNVFGTSSPATSNNIFGGSNASSAPSSNIFGTASTQQNAFASKPADSSNNIFGNNPSSSTNTFGANPPASSANMFSSAASAAPSTNLFSAATSSAAPPNIFGQAASSSPSTNLFTSATPAKSADTPAQSQASSTFGNAATSGPANAFGGSAMPSAPSNNLFASTPSSAPSTNLFGNNKTTSTAPSTNVFGGATASAPSNIFGSTPASSAPANLFSGSTASAAPSANIFGQSGTSSAPAPVIFGASTADKSSASDNALNAPSTTSAKSTVSNPPPSSGSGQSASQTSNMFAQSSTFLPSTSGAGIFSFTAQSPMKATNDTSSTGSGKDASATADDQAARPANIFAPSTTGATPKMGTNLFGAASGSPSTSSSTATPQAGTNLFNFQSQSTPANAEPQQNAQKSTEAHSSSTANLFAQAASGGRSPSPMSTSPDQTGPLKKDVPAESAPSSNPFASIQSSTPSIAGSATPTTKSNGATPNQGSSNPFSSIQSSTPSIAGSATPKPKSYGAAPNQRSSSTEAGGSSESNSSAQASETTATAPASHNVDMSKVNMKNVDMATHIHHLNEWFKMKVAAEPIGGDFINLVQVYIKNYIEFTDSNPEAESSAQAQTKSSGKRKADAEPEAGSPKKSRALSSQDGGSPSGTSNTANVFNSLVNKPTQSPLRNVESAAAPDAEPGPSSTNNLFGTSASSPFKLNPSGGASGSTTPAGSPAKPNSFSQSPIKAPVFGQVGTAEKASIPKRSSDEISSDEQEEESQDDAVQNEKRQKTSTPISSADTGSVLNSRQASPDARNPFGHLSQEESNKDGDDDEASDEDAADQGSTTPTATPKRSNGLFGRITKDDSTSDGGAKTSGDGGLLGRVTGTSTENAGTNPFGFSASSYEVPGAAKTGPVLKTWNGDAGSPIKFGTSQPTSSDNGKKETSPAPKSSNPFSGIATGSSTAAIPLFKFTPASTPPAGDASPFKFNPPAATSSGTSSVFASGLGSRATTPGVSTGASENETSAAENDEEEEAQPVDEGAQRAGLTEEDKKTYEILFDTDTQSVTLVHLVNRSKEEMEENPTKSAKKWEPQGKGPVRVLKHKESGGVSILLKTEPAGRVLINTRVQPAFHYKKAKVKFATFPLPGEDGKIVNQYLKFEDDAECDKFVEVCESNKSS